VEQPAKPVLEPWLLDTEGGLHGLHRLPTLKSSTATLRVDARSLVGSPLPHLHLPLLLRNPPPLLLHHYRGEVQPL
jgi:hypothetical protein